MKSRALGRKSKTVARSHPKPSSPPPFLEAAISPLQGSRGKALVPEPLESYIAAMAAAGILLYLILRHVAGVSHFLAVLPLYVTLALGGGPLIAKILRKLLALDFGSDLLAGVSIVGAVLMGQFLAGAIVVLMLSGGAALEHYASRRASSVLDSLARRMPRTAHHKKDGSFQDVDLSSIAIGDELMVFPHEICPVDGVVTEGQGVMDESYLTGEPFSISKAPGSQVLSGTINGDTALTIAATKLAVDSRYSRIMQVVEATGESRPRLRRIGDRIGAWYTPLALGIAALSWASSHDPLRFLAVTVVATPCPLLIAIPVAVIGAISLAARQSIIIKNPAVLEQIDTCRTIIFDKTGTLTYGRPKMTEAIVEPGFARQDVLRMAASVEQYSKHPLAGAVLRAAQEASLVLEPATRVSEKPGEGLCGVVGGRTIQITGRGKVPANLRLPPLSSGLECLVLLDGSYAAAFRFHDSPRPLSDRFVKHLKPRHSVEKVMLVSGDRLSEVRYLAEMVGITEIHAAKSPEEKVEIVRQETERGPTLFVGDGINDAPALLAATVGVAFGQNSDITSEAADAVILEASLRKVDELIHIGRRMRSIALVSAGGGMALSVVGMLFAAAGYLGPVAGAVAQELIDLAAVMNALRVAFPPGDLADF
jgi:heavy metal translocating P-type ATPase